MVPDSTAVTTTLLYVFVAALAGGIAALKLRFPMVVGYILAGMIMGSLFERTIDRGFLSLLTDVGITLLLFSLGVEFSFQQLRRSIGVVFWAVVIQILTVFLLMQLVLLFMGIPFVQALFISLASSFSSTAIAIKVLSEKGELDTTHGQVGISWLIVQDLAIVPVMLLMPAFVSAIQSNSPVIADVAITVFGTIAKAAVILVVTIAAARSMLPWILGRMIRVQNREIFVITIVAVVFLSASLSVWLGLSAAIGAFLAGLIVAETSQNHAIFSEIRPMRDAFSVIFFVTLGLAVPVWGFMSLLPMLLLVTIAALLFKGLIVFGLAGFLRFHKKASFHTALLLLPMSEFGFIIAQEGRKLGALNSDTYTLLLLLSFGTILAAVPLLAKSHVLYNLLNTKIFLPFSLFSTDNILLSPPTASMTLENHVVLCGYGRVGKYIGRALELEQIPFVVIDYNQAALLHVHDRGIPSINGDPADRDVLAFAKVDRARSVIIAVPDRHTQELIIGNTRSINKRIHIICRCHHEEDQKYIKALGVDVVIQPEFEAAVSIASRLLTHYNVPRDDIAGKVTRLKIEHGLM